jgi:hypothetical protein
MTNQKLFEALERLCGFTVLQSDMFEIIRAVEADKMPMTETIEQAAERLYPFALGGIGNSEDDRKNHFIKGAKWQQERMYSEEEVLDILDKLLTSMVKGEKTGLMEHWFKQFKKK